ncbi:MAG TPA: hypothetical protein VIJ60_00525 [Acidimicrobiales bacterium]
MAADGSSEATIGRWRRRLFAGLVAGCLLVPISASAAGAAGTGKTAYAAKVSGLCRSYATTFAQAGAKVGSGSSSGAAAALSKAVSKAKIELQKITSVPKPKAQAAALRQTFAKAKKLLAQLGALAAPVKAHNEQQVAAKLAAIERTGAALAKQFGSVGLSSCAAGAATTSGSQPVLDASVLDSPVGGTSGYGQVKPAGIAISGTGGTNEVTNIVWSSWGGATATGTGTGCVLQSTGIEANCARTPADVVVYELGSCSGKPAYLAMTWYFPSLGQSFTPSTASPTPVGSSCQTTASGGSTSSTTSVPATTTTTAPSTSAASSSAPCNATAITTAAKAVNHDFYSLSGYGCTGDFAYAAVTVTGTQTDNPIATVTMVFMADNGAWQVTSRSDCTQNLIPAGIYQQACESN